LKNNLEKTVPKIPCIDKNLPVTVLGAVFKCDNPLFAELCFDLTHHS